MKRDRKRTQILENSGDKGWAIGTYKPPLCSKCAAILTPDANILYLLPHQDDTGFDIYSVGEGSADSPYEGEIPDAVVKAATEIMGEINDRTPARPDWREVLRRGVTQKHVERAATLLDSVDTVEELGALWEKGGPRER